MKGRKWWIAIWLCLPVFALAFHFGPGQNLVLREQVAALQTRGVSLLEEENHEEALSVLDEALELASSESELRSEARRTQLAQAKAKMELKQLPDAFGELQSLFDEISSDKTEDLAFVNDVRATLAQSQFYMTWLYRLEGIDRQEWEPVIESSRQHYRFLTTQSQSNGNIAEATKQKENLESAIRLARMDISELQGLPLPSQ